MVNDISIDKGVFTWKGDRKFNERLFKEMKMKKKGLLLATVILLSAGGLAQAQEDAIGVTLDATWVSKYLWRGIDLLDDKAAFQPSVDVDLFGSGFSVNVWASYPAAAGDMNKTTAVSPDGTRGVSRVDATEFNYTIAYDTVLCEGEDWATAIRVQGIYRDFIDRPSQAADDEEVGLQVALPNLCPAGVVPSYYVGKLWPAKSGTPSAGKADLPGNYGGWVHIFGLGYDLKIPGLTADTPEQVVSFSAAAVYNDGFAGGGVDHDWSHAVFGVSTTFELAENVNLTPGFYYQSSWEDTVNPEDEMWMSIGASCRF